MSPAPTTLGGTVSLRFGLGADPSAIDPALADDDEGLLVVDALFDSLTVLDANLRPSPAMATSWDVSEDGLTWTFTLDHERRFHDGSRIVGADFVRAFTRITDGTAQPRSFQAHLLQDIAGFEAAQATGAALDGLSVLEDGALQIRLDRPNAELPDILAHPSLAPVPPQATQEPRAFGLSPVGNGPFKMAEPWAHSQFIRLVRADPQVALEEVLFRIYADDPGQAQQYADFVSGQLHVAEVPAASRRTALTRYGSAGDGATGSGVLDAPRATTYQLGFNTTRAPFDDPVVRRAVSLLVDRDRISSEIMLGSRQASTSLLPLGLDGSRPGSCTDCRFDPEAARQLLVDNDVELDAAQVGPITLLHNSGTTHAAIAAIVAAAIEEHLGLTVEVEERELVGFAAGVRAGEVHLFRHGWTAEHGTAGAVLTPLFHSRSRSQDNLFGFVDPEVDRLLDEALATGDRVTRLELFASAEDRVLTLLPVVPVLSYDLGRVVAEDVQGLVMDPLGRIDLADVSLAPR